MDEPHPHAALLISLRIQVRCWSRCSRRNGFARFLERVERGKKVLLLIGINPLLLLAHVHRRHHSSEDFSLVRIALHDGTQSLGPMHFKVVLALRLLESTEPLSKNVRLVVHL